MDTIFYILILIISVVIHEVAHGFMAEYLGDKTARHAGRLTLNPFSHLDFFGSFLIPLVSYFSFGFAFGWAKPVPYNPDNLRDKKWGSVLVASAGVLANLAIAVFFGLFLRFLLYSQNISQELYFVFSSIVLVNLILTIFNLIPIPPLDGSKIFLPLLPKRFEFINTFMEKYSLVILLLFVFFVSGVFLPKILLFLFNLIVGVPLSVF